MYGFVSQICDVKSISLCFLIGVFMKISQKLCRKEEWEAFYRYKLEQGNIRPEDAGDLRAFIEGEGYVPVMERLLHGQGFGVPKKMLINKSKAGKKRAVYTFDREENYVLKLMAFLLRDYDDLFSPNLYSFRKHLGVKKAVENILGIRDLSERYVYKVDISNYFNSVDIDLLLPELEMALAEDPRLFDWFKELLENPLAEYEGEMISEPKGIMAGVPVSAFLANLYLAGLDRMFVERKIPYVRYSDDILVFAENERQLCECIETIKVFLHDRHLTVNPDKEIISRPGEPWTFLGFSYDCGVIDISTVSFAKLKAKMRRKTRSLARWADKKKLPGEYAARAFIKQFNRKLFDNPVYSELTWTRWFFPVINTAATLKQIDQYMQDCIRYLATGTRSKARYQFRYENMKELGYRNLVNEYYKAKQEGTEVSHEKTEKTDYSSFQ